MRKTHIHKTNLYNNFSTSIQNVKPNKNGCLIWPYAKISNKSKNNSYGSIWDPQTKRTLLVHRVSMEIHLRRKLSQDEKVLHKCPVPNPACINPDHLYIGDQKDNMKDRTKHGNNPKGFSHTSPEERELIKSLYFEQNYSKSKIARFTKRSRETINKVLNDDYVN